MFFFRKLIWLFFLGVLFLGIVGAFGRGGHGRYQEAYQQGFIAGQQAAANSEAAPEGGKAAAPDTANHIPGANVYYRGHGFFFPGFGLLFCLVPFFLMGLFFMAFGKRRWHKHGRHKGPWGHHRRGYSPCGPGPWGRSEDAEDSAQESVKEKSPDDIDDGSDEPVFRA